MLRTRIPNPIDLRRGVVDDPQGIFGQGSTHTVAVVPFPLIRKQPFLGALPASVGPDDSRNGIRATHNGKLFST